MDEVAETTAEILPEIAEVVDPEYTQNLFDILAELQAINSNLGVLCSVLVYILLVLIIYGLYKLFKSLFIS